MSKMGTKDPFHRCIEALNRDQERQGLLPVQVEKVFFTFETKPVRKIVYILTVDAELIRYSFRAHGPVVRLGESYYVRDFNGAPDALADTRKSG
jgi:hypothetical protein